MHKTTRTTKPSFMAGWARRIAVVGLSLALGLVSLQAGAFATGRLEATEPEEAVREVMARFSHGLPGSCQLEPLDPGINHAISHQFFRMTCPDRTLFIKRDGRSRAIRFTHLSQWLERELPAELAAAVVQPLAEFVFEPAHSGERAWYSVYPWVDGVTLAQLFEDMFESGVVPDPERLHRLYHRLGSQLGGMHRAGLVNAGAPLDRLRARAVHQDLHPNNLMVTPDDGIVLLDPDSFKRPNRPVRIMDVATDDFPDYLLFTSLVLDDFPSSAWLLLLPGMTETLLGSYCHALVGEQGEQGERACVAHLADRLAEKISARHKEAFETWGLFDSCSLSPTLDDTAMPVDEREIQRRLEAIFGRLR